jgi:hypothetical protein
MSIAEWARGALSRARRNEPSRSVEKKLAALREAAKYKFPAADIDTMLEEIERGYDGMLP